MNRTINVLYGYLHLGTAQGPKIKRKEKQECKCHITKIVRFETTGIDEDCPRIFMSNRNKHGGQHFFISYQLSKFADTRISSFGLKKKLSQCHFLRSEEGRHLGKKGKCIFGRQTTVQKLHVTSPPYDH